MSFKGHKHKTSAADDLSLSYVVFTDTSAGHMQGAESPLISPAAQPSTAVMRKAPSGSIEQSVQATAGSLAIPAFEVEGDSSSSTQTPLLSPDLEQETHLGTDGPQEALFVAKGTRVKACLTRVGVHLTALRASCVPCMGRATLGLLPFDEMLAVEGREQASIWASACCGGQAHSLVIHTIRRSLRSSSLWHPITIELATTDGQVVQEWVMRINAALRMNPQRPRSLLVIVNPYGGARKALQVWETIGAPTFNRTGIKHQTVVTEREGHARQVVERLQLAELRALDGIVAVGGDGLFQEIMNGVLSVRARGSEEGAAAQRLRLGHIPAGSTDAVAYSINGTRSHMTAALHIAMGDRMPVDVMRVDTADGAHRFAICVASYGYMGDLMRASEKLRWMGPPRYNTAGTITLFKGRSYQAKVAYKPADASSLTDVRTVCRSQCNLCRASPSRAGDPLAFTRPATAATEHGAWKFIEGSFKSIMAVVIPCRSDQSTLGLSPYGHLADGRLHLILVRNCSILQYLRFLASIPQTGVEPGAFPFVEVIDVTAVQVTPVGEESCWNVDGEILANSHFAGEVHRGLLEVFARGVE